VGEEATNDGQSFARGRSAQCREKEKALAAIPATAAVGRRIERFTGHVDFLIREAQVYPSRQKRIKTSAAIPKLIRKSALIRAGQSRYIACCFQPRPSCRRRAFREEQRLMLRKFSQLRSFARYSWGRIQVHREEKGRLPRLTELPLLVRKAFSSWRRVYLSRRPTQPSPLRSRTFQVLRPIDTYDAWLEVNEWNARRESVLRERLSGLTERPLLSVVMPVHNPPIEWLNLAIHSVINQVYENWELCIADDGNTDPLVKTTLKRWTDQDPRIRMVIREENGNISRATNSGAELARGEYLVLLDQDDEITPDALAEVAAYLAAKPETDILYSDDDKIDLKGRRYDPQFKPDWSPELLLSYMYFSHLFVIRRNLFLDLQGMRVGFEGSQDYDLALRASEKTKSIGHIPKILYHWRALPTSTASSASAKPESFDAGIRAVQDAFDRRGIQGEVFQPDWALKAKCGIFSHRFPNEGPSVAIIIPTKNNVGVLKACVESIKKTTYRNYKVVIVDNESDDPSTLEYLADTPHMVLRIANHEKGFSFAAINNRAVEQINADYLLFLNNDTEVITPEWLTQMVGYLKMPGVGAVGARLLFPDGRIQHAGVVCGYYNGMAGPAFKLLSAHDHGYLSYTRVTRNYSAVTAACMLTPRPLFLEMGGFDEREFAVAYNDVDYCCRLRAAGHRIVYCPTAELVHKEGYSRGFVDNPNEPASYRRKYGGGIDPYYNPNLSLDDERFAINARTLAPRNLKPIRALMCGFNLNREGSPNSQYELTVKLKEEGIIEPLVYSPTDGPLRQMYEANGIRVEVFKHPLTGVVDVSEYQERIAAFARQIKEWNIELVYANTVQTFYAIDAAHDVDLPSIWNPRESEPWETYFDYLPWKIAHRALRCFEYPYEVVFVSNATQQAWQRLNSRHNFMVIHNGLNRERFAASLRKWPREDARRRLKIRPTELVVLLLGTVCERKGQIDLVAAVGRLNDEHAQRIRCLIVGDRPSEYSERLRQTLNALPRSRRSKIEVIAETSDPALYYAAADIFVCCSRIESFPRVTLEAMAAGVPIITTPVFGIVEQVKENVSALFYPPGDAQALADRIARLIEDEALRERLAAGASATLNALTDFDSMVDAYAEVFREAWLNGATRSARSQDEIRNQ
jgi:GT2 family glycosyltransferase/glycosyltransferase involved in cell wall biosynthesis